MRALLQRVSRASVRVAGESGGESGPGSRVVLGLDQADDEAVAERMLEKLLAYRLFNDAEGRMNRNVVEAGGGVLLVSQFTLSADTRKGLRPGFSRAMAPAPAEALYSHTLERLRQLHDPVAAGIFGAHMQIELINDGPVTFLLEFD